jgi:hypothetical protein
MQHHCKMLCIAILVFCASIVMAGDYHSGATLVCTDCHTMHYSISHDYDGTTPSTVDLGTSGPHEALLKDSPNELCLQCHDGQTFAPDVKGTNTNSYVREAGAIPTGAAPYEEYKGHSLGSMDTPPGNDGTYVASAEGLRCNDCHMQHGGNGVYRNLTTRGPLGAAATITYATGTNDTTKDVFQRNGAGSAMSDHYTADNVDFNEPNITASKYALWCKNCHSDFHGDKGSANMGGIVGGVDDGHDWLRHPTAGVDIGGNTPHGHSTMATFNRAGKTNYVKVMDAAGQWNYAAAGTTSPSAAAYTPSCFTCHKAHGNQNAFGLIEMGQTGTVTEEGTVGGTPKMLCQQCHGQGF